MELFRLHAYAISPHRSSSNPTEPTGGAVQITAQLRTVLEESTASARFERRTVVDFDTDLNSRTNETRTCVVDFGFGEAAPAKAAALALSRRLAEAMDMRSTACLLVLAAVRQDDRRRVTIWTFPRDQALRLRSGDRGPSMQVLTDVFSQTSKLRKAALFEGRNLRNEFLQGRVLDFQANQVSHDVADFWIRRFLQCTLSIGGDAGTRMLAKTR